MRFFGEWATVSSLVCFYNLFIFLSISIDTENHPSIPYFHPTHRGRFKHQCSEVPNTNLVCCRCTFDLRGETLSFCSQSICVGVYLAGKGLSCVNWGQIFCLGFWGGCLLTVLQHTPWEPRFWVKNGQSNWLICRASLTPALVQLAQWVHEHGEVSDSTKKLCEYDVICLGFIFPVSLCFLWIRQLILGHLPPGFHHTLTELRLQPNTFGVVGRNLGWWCLHVSFNSSLAKKGNGAV